MKKRLDPSKRGKILADARRYQADRGKGYREQALSLFPPVCGRCGREFSGKALRELTVHHKDHDPTNNPPDGSNWELLCLYCHDEEHQDTVGGGSSLVRHEESDLGFNPFAALGDRVKPQEDESLNGEEDS